MVSKSRVLSFGFLGVRTFVPRPVAELISYVGGTTTLLGLVAMANDVEMLYAAVKALCCVLKYSFSAREDMERIKGYQVCFFNRLFNCFNCFDKFF